MIETWTKDGEKITVRGRIETLRDHMGLFQTQMELVRNGWKRIEVKEDNVFANEKSQ